MMRGPSAMVVSFLLASQTLSCYPQTGPDACRPQIEELLADDALPAFELPDKLSLIGLSGDQA